MVAPGGLGVPGEADNWDFGVGKDNSRHTPKNFHQKQLHGSLYRFMYGKNFIHSQEGNVAALGMDVYSVLPFTLFTQPRKL